jgi:hypothetical protein
MKQNVEQLYKTNLVLWSAFLLSQSAFFMVLYVAKPNLFKFDFSKPFGGENLIVVVIFGFMAIINLFIGLFLRIQAVQRAIDEQNPKVLQSGLILGMAFCESLSILGLVLAFAFDYQYFFLWFILAIIGMMLHYPRRQNYHDASFRKQVQ